MASIICQAYKTALDIPRYISTQQLHHLGVRNLRYIQMSSLKHNEPRITI